MEVHLKSWVKPLQFLLTVGWYVALSLLIPVAIGYWLDRPEVLDKRPLFTLIGLGVGTVIAFSGLFRMLIRYQAEQEKRNIENKNGKRK
ncbi:MAG TPA: AtpZ/AtpI family protein [Thermodesulfobacteriota bacterium]|nr:AtpZ/AtpI family protein [Thermodesulfobacteriota bacterium]